MLKRTEQILGLPLITISDGKEMGVIRQLVINPEMGRIEFLLLNDGPWYTEPKVLPYELVLGIGHDAVTTESATALDALPETAEVVQFLERKVEVIGTRVITRRGRMIGLVAEMVIEIESGRVVACEIVNTEKQFLGFVPSEGILTFGRDVLVVDEKIDDLLIESLDQLSEDKLSEGTQEEEEEQSEIEVEAVQVPSEESSSLPQGDGASLFEERQKQFLIGKKVTRTVFSDAGEMLAQEGDIVNLELLEKARVAGKFIELTASVDV